MAEGGYVFEVPQSIQKLALMVTRSFYSVEDYLIVSALVRFSCLREERICELLKFERKMLRSRVASLRNDKIVQCRILSESKNDQYKTYPNGAEIRAQRTNCYFINYKTFVNAVKYKLEQMRKKMESREKDTSSRASFVCPKCHKTFTDLEADQLFQPIDGTFRCFICSTVVEEQESRELTAQDSGLLLARFNQQTEPLYQLLRDVEGIKLAPSLLDPPLNELVRDGDLSSLSFSRFNRPGEQPNVSVVIDSESTSTKYVAKETPKWMTDDPALMLRPTTEQTVLTAPKSPVATVVEPVAISQEPPKSIMSVLLEHEQSATKMAPRPEVTAAVQLSLLEPNDQDISLMASDDDEDEEQVPQVLVGGLQVPINEVSSEMMTQMSNSEKEAFVKAYQDYYENSG